MWLSFHYFLTVNNKRLSFCQLLVMGSSQVLNNEWFCIYKLMVDEILQLKIGRPEAFAFLPCLIFVADIRNRSWFNKLRTLVNTALPKVDPVLQISSVASSKRLCGVYRSAQDLTQKLAFFSVVFGLFSINVTAFKQCKRTASRHICFAARTAYCLPSHRICWL